MRSSRPRLDPFAALSPAGQSQRSIVETAHDVDMLRCPAVDKDWELISLVGLQWWLIRFA